MNERNIAEYLLNYWNHISGQMKFPLTLCVTISCWFHEGRTELNPTKYRIYFSDNLTSDSCEKKKLNEVLAWAEAYLRNAHLNHLKAPSRMSIEEAEDEALAWQETNDLAHGAVCPPIS